MKKEMEYIYAVYRYKSFSKAAENLFISQPALSAIVKKTEDELQTPLFDRSTHPIRLTQAGEYYIEQTERIITIEKDMGHYFHDLQNLNTGTITIGAGSSVSSYFLSTLIGSFRKDFPKISFNIREGSSPKLFDSWLKNGIVDLVFAIMPIGGDKCVHIPFMNELLILAVPKSATINQSLKKYQLSYHDIRSRHHHNKDFPAVSLSNFANEAFIFPHEASDMYVRSTKMFENAGILPNITLQLDQNITSYFMTANNYGISIIRDNILDLVCDTENIVFYKIDDPLSTRTLSVHYRKDHYLSKISQEFISYVKSVI